MQLIMRYLAILLMVVPIILNAAEYKAAEETAPKSVDDISNTLANVAARSC
jgi:hypothetical protein